MPDDFGGNMDCPEVRAGNTVYLGVRVPGALVSFGDGHFAMGDGEIMGTAIEGAMNVELTVDLVKKRETPWPRIENAEWMMSLGAARPLEDAARIAFKDMVRWVQEKTGLGEMDAYEFVSQNARAPIVEIVDPEYTVLVKIPKAGCPARAGTSPAPTTARRGGPRGRPPYGRITAFTTCSRSMSSSACPASPSAYSRVTRSRHRNRSRCLRHHRERPVEVRELVAPAAADVGVLPVDVPVWIDRDVAAVGVLTDDDVSAGVSQHLEPLGHRGGVARGLDHDVGAAASGPLADEPHARGGIGNLADVADFVGAEAPRRLEPRPRRADDEHPRRAGELREDRGVQSDRTAALHDDRIAERDVRPLDGVEARRQAAAAAEEIERLDAVRQRHDAHARLELHALRPAAEQPFLGRGRDAVDAAVRTPRGGARDEAVPAGAAGAEDVVERHERPVGDRPALDVADRAVRFRQAPADDVPGDDRVRDAGEASVMEVDVRPADLARDRLEHGASGSRTRRRKSAHLDRPARGGQDRGADVFSPLHGRRV